MPEFNKDELRGIKSFGQLIKYLRDELDWPIETDDFEDSTFDYEPEELGIDPETAAKIQEIKQLRPLTAGQPWGIFFVKFEPKKLPVVVLRRILSKLVIKKRTSAVKSEQAVWNLHDLLFISNYGEGDHRQMTFANFSQDENNADLPTLKVLGWDYEDTELHLDNVHHELKAKLRWPADEKNIQKWRETWSSAFILRNQEVITTSKDLAIRLAALAQRIRERVKKVLELENTNGAMRQLYRAFQETLIHDLKEDDFADMYAQTIAYGLLAARMSRPMGITSSNITDMVPNTNPFLRDILGTFITTGGRHGKIDFDELGVQEIVELLNSPKTHMEAILRDFGNRTRQEDPVIHFYELFLTEYDQDKKVQRGVFYTPQPVVSYIVRSVHELLQKEFGLIDGLADITTWGELPKINKNIKIPEGVSPAEPFVQILDPALGTGTFLVEVIDIIYKTMTEKWLKQGHMALEFPQLWNDYVPQHLLPRLYGYELMMAPYAIAHMRLGLKLFETGYKFGAEDSRVNVYLTNSLETGGEVGPHRKFEQLAPALAREAKAVNGIKWNKRFTVIIGNPPYSFRSSNKSDFIMTLLEDYRKGLNERKPQLNDDYVKFFKFGQYTISYSSQSILAMITNNSYLYGVTHSRMRASLCETFSTINVLDLGGDTKFQKAEYSDENVFDIQQGVSIGIFLRKSSSPPQIQYRRVKGTRVEKYEFLNANSIFTIEFEAVAIQKPFYFCKALTTIGNEYDSWTVVTEIFPSYINGIVTSRDAFSTDYSRQELVSRVKDFSSLKKSSLLAKYESFGLKDNTSTDIDTAQSNLTKNPGLIQSSIVKCSFRPFDLKYIAYDKNILHRTREEVMHNLLKQNIGLVFCRNIRGDIPCHFFVADHVVMKELISSKDNCYVAPLYIYQDDLFKTQELNLSPAILSWIKNISCERQQIEPLEFFEYVYAIVFSPHYRKNYSDKLQSDFPRIPLVSNPKLFSFMAILGKELVALHLLVSEKLNTFITTWQGSRTSCEVDKISYSDNTVWINKAQSEGFFRVPEDVWNFHIGGYQVCDKWLKDRKGRSLSAEDINHYQKIVVALNETIRLMKEIDEVIDQHGGWPGAFQ